MKNQWHALLNAILDRETVREIFLLEEGCPKPEEYGFLTPDQYAKDGICPVCDDIGLRVVWTNRGDEPVCCVVCPDCGGLEIPKEQLRQWKINMTLFLEKLTIGFGVNPMLKTIIPKKLWLLGQKDGIEYYFVPYLSHFDPEPTISELLKSPKSVVLTVNEMYANLLNTYIKQPCLSLKTVASLNHDGTIVADISEQLKVAFPDVSAPPFEFRKKGQMWVVRYQGKETFLKDALGPYYVSMLLQKPHKFVFAVALHAMAAGQSPDKEARVGTAECVLDEQTKSEIENQLQILLSEIEEAKDTGDHLVEQESQNEYDELFAFYQKNIGLGGQIRKEHDGSAKIRQAVQKAIQRTIILIEDELPECGAHLDQSISTGTKFNYKPEQILDWVLGIIFEYKSSNCRDLAASLQQTIDVKLFQFPECCHALLPVRLRELSASYANIDNKDIEEFKNWYEDYSSLSFYEQIFHSQKENIRWDNQLRRNYFFAAIAAYSVIFCVLVFYAIASNEKVSHFFAIFSWLFPITQFFVSHCFGLWIETGSLKELKDKYDLLDDSFT